MYFLTSLVSLVSSPLLLHKTDWNPCADSLNLQQSILSSALNFEDSQRSVKSPSTHFLFWPWAKARWMRGNWSILLTESWKSWRPFNSWPIDKDGEVGLRRPQSLQTLFEFWSEWVWSGGKAIWASMVRGNHCLAEKKQNLWRLKHIKYKTYRG